MVLLGTASNAAANPTGLGYTVGDHNTNSMSLESLQNPAFWIPLSAVVVNCDNCH